MSSSNNVPTTVSTYIEKGLTSLVVYHTTNTMTRSNDENKLNEGEYYYDVKTGKFTIKTSTFSPFTYVYDAKGTKTVTTADELEMALADTSVNTIVLGADWNDDMYVIGANGIIFDFNGHTVSGTMYVGCEDEYFLFDDDDYASKLTLMDSKGTGGVKTTNKTAICMRNGSELTIESGTYETTSNGSNCGSVIKMSNCNLIVNGGYLHNASTNGNWNYVIRVNSFESGIGLLGDANVTVNGGKFEGNKPNSSYGSWSHLIAGNYSGNVFNTVINGGEFYSYDRLSFLTQAYGDVLVNDCNFIYEGTGDNKVFDIQSGYKFEVKGGDFTVNGKSYFNSDWSK